VINHYPETGSLLGGQYRVNAVLKEGYTAVIIKCQDRQNGRVVAVKRFFPERLTPEIVNKVTREAQFNSRSDYLVLAERVFYEGCYFNAVLPFVEGESLEETVAGGSMDELQATATAFCIASACHDLHGFGVVSTDIKSDNIMVQSEKVSKLIDLSSFEYIGQPTTFSLGTIPYAPKELALGEYLHQSTDLFSLGIVYFEMLVGQETFEEETAEWENIIRNGRKPDISIVQCFHPEASKIISRAIEPNPHDRYRTAAQMGNDLYRHYQKLSGKELKSTLVFICNNGNEIKIPKGTCVIGRHNIGSEWEYISERHLEIYFKDDYISVRDAGSTNGTRLNGCQINGQWIKVKNADVLTLADCDLLVSLTD